MVNISAATTVAEQRNAADRRSCRRARPSRSSSTTSSTAARTAAAVRTAAATTPAAPAAPVQLARLRLRHRRVGHRVTNNHVIGDANDITVIFTDGRKLKAEVVGKDPKVDLAVLRVKSDKPLKAVKFGDSEKARIGDWVMAIGNPFGLGGTVTAGIVSARNRDISDQSYDQYIQTDASINKGNSGGPLFNMDGEVIGINTAILSPTGGSIGIGFAVPSSLAKPVIDQLAAVRRDAPRLARRAHPERRRRHRREPRPRHARAARWSPASTRRARPSRPASRPAT